MKTRKTYLIIELHTNRILHTSYDKFESMQYFDKLLKEGRKQITAQCIYQ